MKLTDTLFITRLTFARTCFRGVIPGPSSVAVDMLGSDSDTVLDSEFNNKEVQKKHKSGNLLVYDLATKALQISAIP